MSNIDYEKLTNMAVSKIPLLEKNAHDTVMLILQKIAEEVDELRVDDETAAKQNVDISEIPVETVSNKDNSTVKDGMKNQGGLKAQDVKDAISEAIELGASDKIIPFVKMLISKYPDNMMEVIKMVKVQLQDGILKEYIDDETALGISNQLNEMIGE